MRVAPNPVEIGFRLQGFGREGCWCFSAGSASWEIQVVDWRVSALKDVKAEAVQQELPELPVYPLKQGKALAYCSCLTALKER